MLSTIKLQKNFHLLCLSMIVMLTTSLQAVEKSYSHVDFEGTPLDQKILELFAYKKKGVYIEVGANDGVKQSNTKRLEEYHGWSGILVEPSETLFHKLCNARPHSLCFQCALGSHEQNNTYVYGNFDGNLMSSVGGERMHAEASYQVLVRSLQSILDETGVEHIDFFSLDTEGYELNILKGIDFEKTTFDYILVEIYTDQFDLIVAFLDEAGYALVENFSNYNHTDNPLWDGTHNDYLFKRRALMDRFLK